MIYLKKLFQSELNSNLDYYSSIKDLPLYNWWKFQETKDLKYFLKVYKDVPIDVLLELEKLYGVLMDEYTKEFGISEHILSVLEKQIQIARLKADFMSGDTGALTMIDVSELELLELVRGVKGMNFNEIKAIIEKNMGFRVDPYLTTVAEYYTYIKMLDGK